MKFKENYEELYNQWISEVEQVNLIQFSEEKYLKYQESKSYIENFNLNDKDTIKIRIIKDYQKNFNYLFDDFMQIRKLKIINSAMVFEEINLDHLIEHEKKFYQNLVSSFKNYSKIKSLVFLPQTSEESKIEETTKSSIKKDTENDDISGGPLERTDLTEDIDYQYTLVRMLKQTPPLVGVDLKNYGPFEKEDIINLPYKNAIILINEKFAVKIELA